MNSDLQDYVENLQKQINALRKIVEENDDTVRDQIDHVRDRILDKINDVEYDLDSLDQRVLELESKQ